MEPAKFAILYSIAAFIVLIVSLMYISKDENDPAPVYLFGGMIGFSILMAPLALVLSLLTYKTCDSTRITSIGGCNRYGTCAVTTSLDIKTIVDMPVVGQTVQVNCQAKWK